VQYLSRTTAAASLSCDAEGRVRPATDDTMRSYAARASGWRGRFGSAVRVGEGGMAVRGVVGVGESIAAQKPCCAKALSRGRGRGHGRRRSGSASSSSPGQRRGRGGESRGLCQCSCLDSFVNLRLCRSLFRLLVGSVLFLVCSGNTPLFAFSIFLTARILTREP
jgi:hypothetical protein